MTIYSTLWSIQIQDPSSPFAKRCLADDKLSFPRAVVMDVGQIRDEGWAVVEANAAWGSGIYGCDPQKVLQVIRHAVEPAARRK